MSNFPGYMKHADDYQEMFRPEVKEITSVYLAGFDVFLQDAIEHGDRLRVICKEQGIEGRYPMDNEIKGGFANLQSMGVEIAWANYGMLFESDAIIANMNQFRGYEPDSGTCAEVGFAVALKKPVFLYLEDIRDVKDKVPHEIVGGIPLDPNGFVVEDFNFPANLMMVCPAIKIVKTFAEAVKAASEYHLI